MTASPSKHASGQASCVSAKTLIWASVRPASYFHSMPECLHLHLHCLLCTH